ncbi:autotransporter outer membrane beta-barrel domain-containing protein [Entomomonas asaccharolytica]|uniref:Autotransporter outer membrane beta-barrel domain-containing protein n=1 Tax=Entomomonas asaccharolytica TaxID=2785331 RepID=A0A974RXM5_9GAMM|nr:autotransporter outer membrane beta-barrel domain-containing protein [Entomomonas asaccharolytica]QQP86345.1 autotransporter outer membrane beta-barrel domain-containing protein [Entomomonas asaccharolytica]
MRILNSRKFVFSTLAINIILVNSFCYAANYVANDGAQHTLNGQTYSSTGQNTGNSALVANGSEIIGSDLNLSSTHSYAAGAFAENGGKISITDSDININAPTTTSGVNGATHSYAIHAKGDSASGVSTVTVEGTNITIDSTGTGAAFAQDGGRVELKDVNITNNSTNSFVLYSINSGANTGEVSKIIADNVIINTSGGSGRGAYIDDGSYLEMNNSQIITTGTSSFGILGDGATIKLTNTSITTSGNNGIGMRVFGGSDIYLDNVNLQTSGASSYGILMQRSTATINNSTLRTTGDNAYVFELENGSNILNITDSTLIAEDSAVRTTGVGNVINLYNSTLTSSTDAALVTLQASTAYLNLYNGSVVTGIIRSQILDNDKIYISINENSIYNGNTRYVQEINLTSGGRWIFDEDNSIGSMDNTNGFVQFNASSATTPITLTTNNLSGAGNFIMQADVGSLTGDLLVVNDSSSGSHTLSIANNGASLTDGTEVHTVVQTPDGASNFSLTNLVEAGGYRYQLFKDGNNWVLRSIGDLGRALTTSASAGVGFFNTGYLSNYIENQTLLQRLGDLRNQPEKTNTGFWIRGYGGKLNSFSGQGARGFDMAYAGTQGGIDTKVELTNADLILGGVVGFTQGNPNYDGGSGTLKNYHAGIYATYYHDNGIYVDGLAKYNNTRNHFSVNDTANMRVKGTGKTQGYAVSLEVGKRFMLNQTKQGVYLEPQAQVTYGYQDSDKISASNGLTVKLKDYNTTQGRVGLNLGYQTGGEVPVNVYLKGNFTREMDGSTSYKLNANKHNYSFKGNWRSGGIGGSINLNKNHNIYMDAEYAKGGRFNQKQLNLGYSYRI